jgi:hypothetical protein
MASSAGIQGLCTENVEEVGRKDPWMDE